MYYPMSTRYMHTHQEDLGALQVHPCTDLTTCWGQYRVVWLRQLHSRKQVRRDALKEREIVRKKLGQVDISDGSQHENVLILIWVLELGRYT